MSMLFWCCFLISGERISSNWISFFGWISWAVFLKMFSLKLKGKRKHCWTWFAIFCSRMHRKKNLRVLIQFVQRFLTVLLKFPAISFFFASHLSSNVFRHFVPVRRPGRPAESSFKMIFCEVWLTLRKVPISLQQRHILQVETRGSHKLPLIGNLSRPDQN